MNNGYIDGSKIIVISESPNNKEKEPEKKKSPEKTLKKEHVAQDERDKKYIKGRYEDRRNK